MNAESYAVLGLGHLGRPLAQKLYEQGSRVHALKRSFTSDDINLPIDLDIADLNAPDVFQTAFWQNWQDCSVWFALLPPSALQNYADTFRRLIQKAEAFGVCHIIFTSSTSVYGEQARECSEHTPIAPETDSARRIAEVEALLLNSTIEHIDILRLGGLYCAERHPVVRLSAQQNISGGGKPVNMIHRDAAVAALFAAAQNPNGKRVRNIVEPEHPTRAEFYTREAAKLGLPAPDFLPDGKSGGKIVNTVFPQGLSL